MKVKFSRCNSNNLIDVPQVDGQLIYTKDTGEAYLDVGNVRKKLTDVEEVANKNSVASPILSKLYYETSTDRLFKAKKVVNEFSQEVIEWIDITGATIDYVDTEILGAKGYTDAEIVKAKSYADGVSGTAESNAKSYTDAEIVKAKSYADNVGTTAEGNAETYADTNFLKKNNTSEFTPTANYHPATKKYVDDNIPDVSNYVQNTDYATNNVGGVIRTGNGFNVLSGVPNVSGYATFDDYKIKGNGTFIGKGTLETVLNNSIIKIGSTTPTTSTVGYRIGQLYLNTTDNKVYQLTSIDDTDPNDIVYTWEHLVKDADLSIYELLNNKVQDIVANSSSQDKYPSTYAVYNQFQRKPVVVWESNDPANYLKGIQADLSASPAWQLTDLDLTPFKKIKIYSCAGQGTDVTANASTTAAMILEMSLDTRAAISAFGGNYVGSVISQKTNDGNRLATLTCAVSSDKTKFVVLRQSNLYGTGITSNNDVNANVFMIEGYYD